MKGWVLRKFFVSKLQYDVIQKDGYFNVGGGVGWFFYDVVAVVLVMCDLV